MSNRKRLKKTMETDWSQKPTVYLENLLSIYLDSPAKQWLKDFIRHRKKSFIWKTIAI